MQIAGKAARTAAKRPGGLTWYSRSFHVARRADPEKGLILMSDLLDKLAWKKANDQLALAEAQQKRYEEQYHQEQFDEAWKQVIRSCAFNMPVDEAAQHFLALGGLLKTTGWDAYLPAEIAYREKALQANVIGSEGRLAFLDLLRRAVAPEPSNSDLVKAFRRVAELRPGCVADGTIGIEAEEIRNSLTTRHANGGKLPKVKPKASTSTASAVNTNPQGKGVVPRDAKFLEWYEARGTDTFHKPAKIHAKWEAMTATQRAEICPDSPNRIAKGTVESGIKRARMKRDGNKSTKSKLKTRKKL